MYLCGEDGCQGLDLSAALDRRRNFVPNVSCSTGIFKPIILLAVIDNYTRPNAK